MSRRFFGISEDGERTGVASRPEDFGFVVVPFSDSGSVQQPVFLQIAHNGPFGDDTIHDIAEDVHLAGRLPLANRLDFSKNERDCLAFQHTRKLS